MNTAETRQRMTREGFEVVASSPQEFGAFTRAEIERHSQEVRGRRIEVRCGETANPGMRGGACSILGLDRDKTTGAWGVISTEQADEFWDDLIAFGGAGPANIAGKEYFLGAAVLVNNGAYHLLLDGQQRLAW